MNGWERLFGRGDVLQMDVYTRAFVVKHIGLPIRNFAVGCCTLRGGDKPSIEFPKLEDMRHFCQEVAPRKITVVGVDGENAALIQEQLEHFAGLRGQDVVAVLH